MDPLPDLLPIVPFTRPVHGSVTLPGSKSLTNRALLLAALSDGPVTLTGALFSQDTHLMADALRALGVTVEADESATTLRVSGQQRAFAASGTITLDVGLAGTAARFLTALCAAAPRGVYRIDGVPQMRLRPMRSLIVALRDLGADVRCLGEEGFFPLEIHARGLTGGTVELDASESSQLLSALLMVAPLAERPVTVRLTGPVRRSYVEMSLRLMAEFGLADLPSAEGNTFALRPAQYRGPATYVIEPDASAASYFHALPVAVGGSLTMPGLRPTGAGLQGDAAFADVLARLRGQPVGTPIDEDFHPISDTFLTLAALAPLLGSPMLLRGLAHTRKQETDRLAGMARELTRLGQSVTETEDSISITPRPLVSGQIIETYHDHRFAMSFAILGCHDLLGNGQPWLTIRNPACCAKTFPHFFTLLDSLRQKSSHS